MFGRNFRERLLTALTVFFAVTAASWAKGEQDGISARNITIGNWYGDYAEKPQNEQDELQKEWRIKIQKDNNISVKEKIVTEYDNLLRLGRVHTAQKDTNISQPDKGWKHKARFVIPGSNPSVCL
jgi:hypothetical protein